MYYTLGTAAKACGKSKPTILNAIKRGRLSASRNDLGNWQIDPAELLRVYPVTSNDNPKALQPETPLNGKENKALEAHVKVLEQIIEDLRADKQALRGDVAQWQGVAAHLSEQIKQLSAPTPQDQGGEVIEAEAAQPDQQRAAANAGRGLWGFFFPWMR